MATILRAYNNNFERFDLDLFNEQSFLLDISAIESGDLGKVFGVSSQTFALPATDNNNAYFGNLYDVGTIPATSFIKTFPCQVIVDGEAIFSGNIYLESVVTDSKGDTIYNAVVVNETVDFKYQIQDLTMGDLDWSDYQHDLTYTNISQSWDLDLFSGDVVYPLVEYGIQNNDLGDASLLVNGGDNNTFTNYYSPLKSIDFKPAIRVKTILNKIFEATDYTYSSSLFDSAYMDTVYVLATQDESRNAGAFTSPQLQTFSAYNSSSQTLTNNIFQKVTFNSEFFDNSGNFDTTTSTFRPDVNGDYSFNFGLPFQITNQNGFSARTLTFYLYVNGSPAPNIPNHFFAYTNVGVFGASSTFNGIAYGNFNNVPLQAGDDVTLHVKFSPALAVPNVEVCRFNGLGSGKFQMYQGAESSTGGIVNLGGCFNPEEKVIDFLGGIIEKFNLVFVPSKTTPTTMEVETFNTWRDAGSQVDWTDRVDRSVKWEIRHPLANTSRDLYFSDELDKDYFNGFYTDILDKGIYGDYNYLSDNDLGEGTRKIGKYFASTPMRYIDGTNDFIVPQIYTAGNVGDVKKRFVFKPRLFHYLGKKENSQLDSYFYNINLPLGAQNQTWWMENESNSAVSQSYYPVFHHVNELPATSASLDLHFGNLNHYSYHQTYVNAETPKDAFYTYWSEYVNELYDVESRLVTLNVKLKPHEVQDIKLNDKIFIDGHYYRINKISGANLTIESSVKAELIKVNPRKLKYPRRRITDLTGSYTDLVVNRIDDSGRVEYVDYETDVVITSSLLLSQASGRDGYRYFSGSNEVIWKASRTNVPTSNVSNGVNYVDDRAVDVQINGSNNTIGAYVRNATIAGTNNTILDGGGQIDIFGNNVTLSGSVYQAFVVNHTGSVTITDTQDIIALNPVRPINGYDNNKVVIGNSLNQGAQYETYNVLEVSAGSVYYLTGSAVADRFHWHFTWSGSNGTAIVYINDSTNPEYDGQLQRFTSDSTLTASNVVNITPISGTIDGNAEEALTTPYDGMTGQVINGEWQVIQRKK